MLTDCSGVTNFNLIPFSRRVQKGNKNFDLYGMFCKKNRRENHLRKINIALCIKIGLTDFVSVTSLPKRKALSVCQLYCNTVCAQNNAWCPHYFNININIQGDDRHLLCFVKLGCTCHSLHNVGLRLAIQQ